MAGERLGVADIDQPLDQPERVIEFPARLETPFHPEGQKRRHAAAEISFGQIVKRTVGKPGILHPLHTRIGAQEFRHGARILDMALDAQSHRLDALQQQEGAHRRENGSGGALMEAANAGGEGGTAEALGIDKTMIGKIGPSELREPFSLRHPVERAAVHDDAAHCRAMPAHEFGERMHHHIGAMRDRPHQDGRGDGIVHDQGHAVLVRDIRNRLDVADIAGGIADRLAE